jgi:hypothetical protein
MERRAFLAASTAAAASTTSGLAAASAADPLAPGPAGAALPVVYELRRYRLHTGTMATRLGAYLKDALVPALGRMGIGPVGVFNVAVGEGPTAHVLIPHKDAGSAVTLVDRLSADALYLKAAEPLRGLPSSDPPYVRVDSTLSVGVPTFPGIEKPAGAAAGPNRLFELRTYRSHSVMGHRKKVEMFEQGGELDIFRRVGLGTVFFSRDVVGAGLPSLTYMLVFADAATREKGWDAFRQDPAWLKLRAQPGYADAEIVSGITSTILRPAEGSQL